VSSEILQQLHNQQCKNKKVFLAITRDDALPSAEAHKIIPKTIRVVVVWFFPKYLLLTRKMASCLVHSGVVGVV
jgi:hypothetical protein